MEMADTRGCCGIVMTGLGRLFSNSVGGIHIYIPLNSFLSPGLGQMPFESDVNKWRRAMDGRGAGSGANVLLHVVAALYAKEIR